MENSKCRSIPMQEKLKLSKSQGASTPTEVKCMQNISYASSVRSIMYAMRCTRPDVTFAQNITSQFRQNPVLLDVSIAGINVNGSMVLAFSNVGVLLIDSMAASGSLNVMERRAIDEISECSGETETPKYMKAFILQEISESRRLIRVLCDEVYVAKTALGQVNAMIAEMEAMNDLFEYADSLGCLRDSKRIMGWKIMGLKQRIEDTEGKIRTFEGHLDIMDAAINSE
ncbi:hypothetical protein Tco_0558463 [Tanacetum coccineum]